ncbi:MAG: hypothetical protein KDI13_07950 [Alphaproteobacteria bacterium]|nr:hypothetical protein [Alphaproteobacteria bacterium]
MKNERGNALFFILIAVALLGLLTATLTRNSSTVDQAGDFEQTRISASKILNTAKSIENAVQELQSRGCSENDISFENTTVSGYTNAGSPSDGSCSVFETNGTGLTYQTPKTGWLDTSKSAQSNYGEWVFTANNYVVGVGTGTDTSGDATPSNKDLIVILPYISSTLCAAVNDLVGVTNPSGAPPTNVTTSGLTPKYTGTFSAGDHIKDTSGTDALNGKESGCFEGGGIPASGTYHFYQVLIAR